MRKRASGGQELNTERKGGFNVKEPITKLYTMVRRLFEDSGQDLIEYALVVALIAFAATVGMSSLANSLNTAFGKIGTTLTTYIT
jgi:pilus assembly protein Flp/PilA